MGHLPKTDAAEAELAVDRMRSTTPLAAGVATNLELRLGIRLVDQRGFCHGQFSFNGKPR